MGYQIFYFMAIFNLHHLLADQTESCEMITRCRTPFTFLACDGCRANMVYWITVANLLSFWHTKQICSIHIWEMTWLVFYSWIYNKSPYVAALAFIWNHAIALHLHSFSLAPTHKGKKKLTFLMPNAPLVFCSPWLTLPAVADEIRESEQRQTGCGL